MGFEVVTTFLIAIFLAYTLYSKLGIGKKIIKSKKEKVSSIPLVAGYEVPRWLLYYRPEVDMDEIRILSKIKDININEFKNNIASIYAIMLEAYCRDDIATLKQLTKRSMWKQLQDNIEKRKIAGLKLAIEFSSKPEIKIIDVTTSPTQVKIKINSRQFHIITDKQGQENENNHARQVEEIWFVTQNKSSSNWRISAIS